MLIEACKNLDQSSYTLDIVGKLDDNPFYVKQINTLIENYRLTNIKLYGALSDADLEKMYLSADIYVHPSLWEGYGMVIAEAMWYGLPIVALNISAMPEVVKTDYNAFLIEPDNIAQLTEVLQSLIHNKELRQKMGENSYKLAQTFNSWEDTCLKLYELAAKTADWK
jgi:glycosyltransferase involved in cell wall biosynthesis